MLYNPINHWVLVVIEISTKKLFYLDPMNGDLDPDLRDLINGSMKFFAAKDGNQKWAYTSMVKKVQFNGKQKYSQFDLDVVRDEWALRLTELIKAATSEAFLSQTRR